MTEPEAPETDRDPEPRHPVVEYVSGNPIASGFLFAAILGGAVAGYIFFEGTLSTPRSILGGALAGFGSWLLVMVGRVIDD
jgi:hypothetical protein